jgi:5-methyltetrahydropteroyltriglutamate--homocysteine methyltransferase
MSIRTTVVGSYPLPGWLEFALRDLDAFGTDDRAELADDAVTVAVMEQARAGLDTITDGEPTRFDFNLSFYGFIDGIDRETDPPRHFGPPAHDQRGHHEIVGELQAPRGLGVVAEWERLRRLAPEGPALKVSVPGPYTLAGRLTPNAMYADRWAITEALLPLVRAELVALVEAGAPAITIDEPSMSCYGWKEDVDRMVEVFTRTIEPVVGKARLGTHLCFGNFKGHAVGRRTYTPLFPAFLGLPVDEIHVEMANREMAELEVIAAVADAGKDVAVGVVDVKSYYIETPEDVAARATQCLSFVPAERLLLAPDCGLSQTARWAARRKIESLVAGARLVG